MKMKLLIGILFIMAIAGCDSSPREIVIDTSELIPKGMIVDVELPDHELPDVTQRISFFKSGALMWAYLSQKGEDPYERILSGIFFNEDGDILSIIKDGNGVLAYSDVFTSKIHELTVLSDGYQNGFFIRYRPNGTIEEFGETKLGMQKGSQVTMYADGLTPSHISYYEGSQNSEWTFYENGTVNEDDDVPPNIFKKEIPGLAFDHDSDEIVKVGYKIISTEDEGVTRYHLLVIKYDQTY